MDFTILLSDLAEFLDSKLIFTSEGIFRKENMPETFSNKVYMPVKVTITRPSSHRSVGGGKLGDRPVKGAHRHHHRRPKGGFAKKPTRHTPFFTGVGDRGRSSSPQHHRHSSLRMGRLWGLSCCGPVARPGRREGHVQFRQCVTGVHYTYDGGGGSIDLAPHHLRDVDAPLSFLRRKDCRHSTFFVTTSSFSSPSPLQQRRHILTFFALAVAWTLFLIPFLRKALQETKIPSSLHHYRLPYCNSTPTQIQQEVVNCSNFSTLRTSIPTQSTYCTFN